MCIPAVVENREIEETLEQRIVIIIVVCIYNQYPLKYNHQIDSITKAKKKRLNIKINEKYIEIIAFFLHKG